MSCLLALAAALLQEGGATVSFSGPHLSSHPGTIEGRELLRINIRGLPRRFDLWRAVLHPGRDAAEASPGRLRDPLVTHTRDGREIPLPLRPPDYASFDATEALRHALSDGRIELVLAVRDFPGYRPLLTRLDVSGGLSPVNEIPRVEGLKVRHADGQTFLSWREVERPPGDEDASLASLIRQREALVVRSRRVRYRVYRSDGPFRGTGLREAECLGEVEPLSGWNAGVFGSSPGSDERVPRFVVREGDAPLGAGDALCVVQVPAGRRSYYAVAAAIHGEEDLTRFGPGDSVGPLDESPGPGRPVLQERREGVEFAGVAGATLHRYVRWERTSAEARFCRPFDYLVALPPERRDRMPFGLHLHGWGGRLDRGFGPWLGGALISSVMSPFDGWTGYHEHLDDWRPWTRGQVRPFTQERLLRFAGWTAGEFGLDPERLYAAGVGLGGGGAFSLAIAHPDRLAWGLSTSGVHRPALAPGDSASFERVFGLTEWTLPSGDLPAFDRFDQVRSATAAADLPLLHFSGSADDPGGGWPQVLSLWRALQEARQPHVFVWERSRDRKPAAPPGNEREARVLLDGLRSGRSLPAFGRCSLDDDPGASARGQSNRHLLWEPEVVDEAERWEVRVRLSEGAPRDEATADLTPRRCRNFRPRPGERIAWKARNEEGEAAQAGSVEADAGGIATLRGLRIGRRELRVTLERAR